MIQRLKNAIKCLFGKPLPEKIVKIPVEKVIDDKLVLKDKVALICGGTGGIGKAIVDSFVNSGCKVIVAGTNKVKLSNILKEYENNSDNISAVEFDVRDVSAYSSKITEFSNIFGKIDIFVNSIGVHTNNVDFWTMTEDEYDRVIEINMKGVFFLCQEMARYMVNNNVNGNILLISSSRGQEPAFSPYGMSKWAMNGLTQGLAKLLSKHDIVVNAIAPGPTATELIGMSEGSDIASKENAMGRVAMPVEIGNLARLMVSESGRMISGQTIHFSAGRGVWDIR